MGKEGTTVHGSGPNRFRSEAPFWVVCVRLQLVRGRFLCVRTSRCPTQVRFAKRESAAPGTWVVRSDCVSRRTSPSAVCDSSVGDGLRRPLVRGRRVRPCLIVAMFVAPSTRSSTAKWYLVNTRTVAIRCSYLKLFFCLPLDGATSSGVAD